MIVYLASDAAADINGGIFSVQEGKVRIYSEPIIESVIHKSGRWTYDELQELIPKYLTDNRTNSAPPDKQKGQK